jgi:hypothetical protein
MILALEPNPKFAVTPAVILPVHLKKVLGAPNKALGYKISGIIEPSAVSAGCWRHLRMNPIGPLVT